MNLGIGALRLTAGTDFDQLTVTGTASLAGTLNVTLINAFEPSVGDSFLILDGTTTGSFDTQNLPALPAGLVWEVDIASVTLNVVTLPANVDVAVEVIVKGRTRADAKSKGFQVALMNVGADPVLVDSSHLTVLVEVDGVGVDVSCRAFSRILDPGQPIKTRSCTLSSKSPE